MVTIPWTVDLDIPAGSVVPEFDASYTAMHLDFPWWVPGLDEIGMNLETQHEHSYTVHLPFEITISAPDQASPGQTVFFDSSAVLAGTPSFTTAGNVQFGTELYANSATVNLPDSLSYGGLGVTAGGDVSYVSTDTTADQVLSRTIWRDDPFGQPLQLNTAERFEGYELETTGDLDAWAGELDIIQFASNFLPPPVNAAGAAAAAVIDVQMAAGLDIIEQTSLTTQFVTGFYTDDGGATYDDFLINGADRRGRLTIPDTLNAGDTYDIQMTALGLGFTCLFDYLLQGGIDFELEVLSGLFHIDLAEIPIGDAFLIDSWADRFQYLEFLAEFLSPEDFLAAALSFDIVGDADEGDPNLTPPDWALAQNDPRIEELLGDPGVDQGQQSFEFPADAPPAATIADSRVPDGGATLTLMATGIVSLGLFGLFAERNKNNRGSPD